MGRATISIVNDDLANAIATLNVVIVLDSRNIAAHGMRVLLASDMKNHAQAVS